MAAVLLAGAALVGTSGASAKAGTVGPSAIGWWDQTRQNAAEPETATDVPAGGGLVAGADPAAVTGLAPVPAGTIPAGPPVQQAVTALSFVLPPGASATRLVLDVTSSPSGTASAAAGDTAAAPLACPASNAWVPVEGGVWGDRAMADCSTRSSLGADSGTQLVFSDIGHLQVGNALDIVIMPGAAERTVIAAPTSMSLTTVSFTTVGGGGSVGAVPVPSSAPSSRSTTPVGSSESPSQARATPSTAAASPGRVSSSSTPRRAAPSPPPAAGRPSLRPPSSPALPAEGGSAAPPVLPGVAPPLSGAPAPAVATGAGGVIPPVSAVTPAAVPVPVPAAGNGEAQLTGTATQTGQSPQTAPAAQASTVALHPPLPSHQTELLLGLLLLLVLAAVLISRDPDARTARMGAALAVLAGRPAPADAVPRELGVGRFRRPRDGTTPTV